MKKVLLLLSFIFYLQFLPAQESSYKSELYCFSGNINNLPITMFLSYIDGLDIYFGSYHYDAVSQPMPIWGQPAKNGLVELSVDYGTHSEKFLGKFSGDGYSGTWSSDGKKFNFKLVSNNKVRSQFDWVFKYNKYPKQFSEESYVALCDAISFPCSSSANYDLIRNAISPKYPKIDEYRKNIDKQWGEMVEEFKNIKLDEYSASFPSSNTSEMHSITMPLFLSDNIAVFEIYSYFYTGGVHGGSSIFYYVFDLKNNKVVNLKDVISNYRNGLGEIIYNSFMQKYGVDGVDALFDNNGELPIVDNFYITPGGLCFQYAQYEIAPYSSGSPSVIIPLNKISKFLTPYAKKLFNL